MRKHSLYYLVLIVFLLVGIISSLTTYFTIRQQRNQLIEEAVNERIRLASLINETVMSPQWVIRGIIFPVIERGFIEEMARAKDTIYVKVVDSTGQIIFSNLGEEVSQVIDDSAVLTKEIIVRDEVYNGKKIKLVIYPGYESRTYWIAFSLDPINDFIKTAIIQNIGFGFGGLVLILVVLLIGFYGIIGPIKKLIAACDEIIKGNLDVKIDVKSKNEIGDLANAFNNMVVDLKLSHQALEKSKANLEKKVQERTKELGELNKNLEVKVQERTKELRERLDDLERFHKLTVGRELKMVELKKEIKQLKKK